MGKITIDTEIENLKEYLNSSEDTHPDYIPPELKEIQVYVLATHARLERGMETLILVKIKETLGKITKDDYYGVLDIIRPLFSYVSYRNKVDIINGYNDVKEKLVRALSKVNTKRIEFAHPKGSDLRNKYSYNQSKGKQNIRDLFRCLKDAEDELNKYFSEKLKKK